jgi:hypothetical protein
VIGGIMYVMQAQERSNRRDAATIVMADELANISKAARQWATTEGEAWEDGSRHVVSIDDLVDNGLLPDDFAARDPDPLVQGVTPAGQRYTVVSVKNGPAGSLYHDPNVDVGKIRTVIWDEGDPVAGRLERIGIAHTAGAILAWKESVALDTSREHRIPAGVLAVGSGEVRGVGRSFTKDVIDWIENEVTQPAAVALVGFPDLEGDGGGGGTGPTGPAVTQYEDCQVIEDMEGCGGGGIGSSCPWWDPPSCPAGYDELAQPRVCGTAGQTVRSTDVGMMVSGSTQVRETSGVQWPGTCDYGQTDTTWATVSVGGSEIYRTQCAVIQQQQGWQLGPPPNYQQVCTTQTSSGVVPTTSMSGTHGLLCCRPAPAN